MNFFRIPLNIFVCVVLYNVCCTIYDLDIMLDLKKHYISVYLDSSLILNNLTNFYIALI